MTRKERKKAIDALRVSVPVYAMTREKFNDYIQTLNKVMDWLEQEPILDKPHIKSDYYDGFKDGLRKALNIILDEKAEEIYKCLTNQKMETESEDKE